MYLLRKFKPQYVAQWHQKDWRNLVKLVGTYSVSKWEETPIRPDEDGMRATRVSAEFLFAGEIEGTAHVEYLMFYTAFDEKDMHNSQARYVGHLKIIGTTKGKSGSFALTDSGSFQGGLASSEVEIITGSGTSDLHSISGSGSYAADSQGCRWELELDF